MCNCSIKDTVKSQWKNIIVAFVTMITTYISVLYIVLPYSLNYFTSSSSDIDGCYVIAYVNPISCAGCTAYMIEELEKIYGIEKVEYNNNKIVISYNNSLLSYDDLKKNIPIFMSEFDITIKDIENKCSY